MPLSALFLCILAAADCSPAPSRHAQLGQFLGFCRRHGRWPLLAADAFTLIFGFELMSAASWLLVLRGDRRPGDASMSASRSSPRPASSRRCSCRPAASRSCWCCLGAGAKAGLAPLHVWLPRAHPAPPAGVSALMSGGMVKIALYILIRYGFIVFGAAAQPWWGTVLIVAGRRLGAASARCGPCWRWS